VLVLCGMGELNFALKYISLQVRWECNTLWLQTGRTLQNHKVLYRTSPSNALFLLHISHTGTAYKCFGSISNWSVEVGIQISDPVQGLSKCPHKRKQIKFSKISWWLENFLVAWTSIEKDFLINKLISPEKVFIAFFDQMYNFNTWQLSLQCRTMDSMVNSNDQK